MIAEMITGAIAVLLSGIRPGVGDCGAGSIWQIELQQKFEETSVARIPDADLEKASAEEREMLGRLPGPTNLFNTGGA
jgi:hypothetical protein